MKLEILNSELGIAGVNTVKDAGEKYIEQLREKFGKDTNLNQVTYFYMEDRDWIVVNKSHPKYTSYLDLIQSYLTLPDVSRKEAIMQASHESIKQLFYTLDIVINKRESIYKKAV